MDKMGLPAGRAACAGRTDADHDLKSIHGSTQTDKNDSLRRRFDRPLEMALWRTTGDWCDVEVFFLRVWLGISRLSNL
jgi:hypothetical protein